MTTTIPARFAGGPIVIESAKFTHTSTIDLGLPGSLPIPLRTQEAADLLVALGAHLPPDVARAASDRLVALVRAQEHRPRTVRRRSAVDEQLMDLEG